MGVAIPVAGVLLVNQATTGAPLRFAYELLWGKNVGPGFHAAPWGPPHTPQRGLELINLYLLRLEAYLFETPFPALLPALAALALTRRMSSADRLLLAGAAALLGLYFTYWHDGFYLGPRFVYGLIPVAALWSARLPSLVRERLGEGLVHRAMVVALAVGAALAAVRGIPDRAAQYAASFPAFRWDPDRAAELAHVENAVVFVQETWGSAVLARLWSLGVTNERVERLYRNVDTCVLEQTINELEQDKSGADPWVRLEPLMADSLALVPSKLSPDRTERMRVGSRYPPRCVRWLNADIGGTTVLAPLLLGRRRDILYVRNLFERNASLLRRYPGRTAYLLKQGKGEPEPRFVALSTDSILSVK
jgi:hypothetical protein